MCRRVLVCTVLLVPAYLYAFNLNTRHASVFWDPDTDVDSYFGFSVALRKYNGQSWLIVGAPRKNDSRNLYEPGNVFQCGLFRNPSGRCSRLDLDNYGDTEYKKKFIKHKKDHGWVGAAIDVQSNGSRLVACGPRWKNQYHKSDYLMNGICYWTDTTSSSIEEQLLPLVDTGKQGYTLEEERNMILNYYVYGEAGISVHIPKDSNELIIGAPGVLEWKGTVIRYKGSWKSEPQIPNPLRMQELEYEGYFGYSVSSGHFYKNESGHQYVGAAPRSELCKGTVLIFKYNDEGGFNEKKGITILSKLVGQQMGEYFGASLAVLDMNGDGLDDIAVGAPMHSFLDVDEHSYDLGQVYAFVNKDKGDWATPLLLKEYQKPGCRFGSALANLGDINRDGYEDLAVGAPYEYGGGAVYIFLGSASGLDPKPSQTLFGKNFESGVPIQSFGISIARGFDVDQNYYNDVAIGAYDSGTAVVLRTHPVVKFTASLNTSLELISHIDNTALTVTGCIAYHGYEVTQKLKVNLTMKIDDRQRRAILTDYNDVIHDFQMELQRDVISCKTFNMAIQSNIKDIQRPIQLEMMYGLAYNPLESSDDKMCADCPVLDPNEPKSVRKQVRFATGCRNDLCETDLKVEVIVPELGDRGYLVLGNMSKLNLQVTAKNLGEPAFVTQLLVAYPRTIERIRTPSTCEPATNDDPAGNIIRLICDLGNPFKAKAEKTLDFRFSLQDVPPETDTLLINVTISSLSKEINEEDNQHLVHIKILQSADVTILGSSGKEQIDYLYPNKSFIQDLTFTHTYEAWNLGPSPVSEVQLNFWIPLEYLTKKGDIITVFEVYDPKPTLISPSGNKNFECTIENGAFIRDPNDFSEGGALFPLPGFGEDHLNLPTELEKDLNHIRQRRAAQNPTVETHSNRTLYINCSTGGENSLCGVITCKTGPLLAHTSRAVVSFKIRAMLHKIESELDQKNVIMFGTRGDVLMITPPSDVQPVIHKPDTAQVTTMLLGKVSEGSVASWIIIISVLIGLLILLVITTAMHKAGFFKRQKKEELEAMLQESDEPNGEVPDNIADTEPITP